MPKTTSSEDKKIATTNAAKQYRPGQRQQERMLRAARRRRRTTIWASTIITLVVIAVAIAGIFEYQHYTAIQAEQAKQTAHIHATATAKVAATQTALNTTPTPTAGAATPPPVTGTPTTLSNGVQYIDITPGTGATAKSGETISVQYTGWLQSTGKKFDSSYDHGGQPFQFALGQGKVIPGFDAGIVGMKVGGTRRLIIPSAQAYGASGYPPTIPPNANLIFDITLVSIQGQ